MGQTLPGCPGLACLQHLPAHLWGLSVLGVPRGFPSQLNMYVCEARFGVPHESDNVFKESYLPQNGIHLPRGCLGDGGGHSLNHPSDPRFGLWEITRCRGPGICPSCIRRNQQYFPHCAPTLSFTATFTMFERFANRSPGKGYVSILHTRKIVLERGRDSPETVALGLEPQGSPSKSLPWVACPCEPCLLQTAMSPVYRQL